MRATGRRQRGYWACESDWTQAGVSPECPSVGGLVDVGADLADLLAVFWQPLGGGRLVGRRHLQTERVVRWAQAASREQRMQYVERRGKG